MRAAHTRATNAVRWARRSGTMAAAVVLLMSGCVGHYLRDGVSVALTRSDVVNSWCAQAGDRLTIEADGTFLWTSVSTSIYDPLIEEFYRPGDLEDPPTSSPTSISGRWEIVVLGESHRLDLSVSKIDQESRRFFSFELFGYERDGRIVLLFYSSDPDLGYAEMLTSCEE